MRKTCLLALLIATTSFVSAQTLTPSGSLRIFGDSTLHKWDSTATVVTMSFQTTDSKKSFTDSIKSSTVKGMELTVDVTGLKSGEKGLDKNMYAAMNADKYPTVTYKLTKYTLDTPSTMTTQMAKTEGELTISGQTKTIAMDVELTTLPDAIKFKGSYTLNMSDFGIKPPKLMPGIMLVIKANCHVKTRLRGNRCL
jgi:polyisoprenoid-binding protein YceI